MVDNGNWRANANGTITGGSWMSFAASGAHLHEAHSHTLNIQAHNHTINIPAHNHSVSIPGHNHTVSIPGHNHSVMIPGHNHTVSIPGHNHSIDIPGHGHSVTLPPHTHQMEYGIFKTGGVSVGKLHVNGRYIQDITRGANIDLAKMLADPRDNKIRRNTFHTIEIFPVATANNAQALTRIVANVFLQIFTNSRGSGDFYFVL
jgi:type VI protein secretion system component Hcp